MTDNATKLFKKSLTAGGGLGQRAVVVQIRRLFGCKSSQISDDILRDLGIVCIKERCTGNATADSVFAVRLQTGSQAGRGPHSIQHTLGLLHSTHAVTEFVPVKATRSGIRVTGRTGLPALIADSGIIPQRFAQSDRICFGLCTGCKGSTDLGSRAGHIYCNNITAEVLRTIYGVTRDCDGASTLAAQIQTGLAGRGKRNIINDVFQRIYLAGAGANAGNQLGKIVQVYLHQLAGAGDGNVQSIALVVDGKSPRISCTQLNVIQQKCVRDLVGCYVDHRNSIGVYPTSIQLGSRISIAGNQMGNIKRLAIGRSYDILHVTGTVAENDGIGSFVSFGIDNGHLRADGIRGSGTIGQMAGNVEFIAYQLQSHRLAADVDLLGLGHGSQIDYGDGAGEAVGNVSGIALDDNIVRRMTYNYTTLFLQIGRENHQLAAQLAHAGVDFAAGYGEAVDGSIGLIDRLQNVIRSGILVDRFVSRTTYVDPLSVFGNCNGRGGVIRTAGNGNGGLVRIVNSAGSGGGRSAVILFSAGDETRKQYAKTQRQDTTRNQRTSERQLAACLLHNDYLLMIPMMFCRDFLKKAILMDFKIL